MVEDESAQRSFPGEEETDRGERQAAPTSSSPGKPRRGRAKGSGTFDDSAPLQEMRRRLDDGRAKSPNEAAHQVAEEAKGPATVGSKARRLRRKFSELDTLGTKSELDFKSK